MSQGTRQVVLWDFCILDPAKTGVFGYLWFSPLFRSVLSTPLQANLF